MADPQPPWTLQGFAIQTLHLVNIDQVRPLIPAQLNIIALWPGNILSGKRLIIKAAEGQGGRGEGFLGCLHRFGNYN